MPVIVPEIVPQLICGICKAKSAAAREGDSEDFYPTEEGWIIVQVSEILPSPHREQEAEMRAAIEEKTGETIEEEWNTDSHFVNVQLETTCPKHARKIKAWVGMGGEA